MRTVRDGIAEKTVNPRHAIGPAVLLVASPGAETRAASQGVGSQSRADGRISSIVELK